MTLLFVTRSLLVTSQGPGLRGLLVRGGFCLNSRRNGSVGHLWMETFSIFLCVSLCACVFYAPVSSNQKRGRRSLRERGTSSDSFFFFFRVSFYKTVRPSFHAPSSSCSLWGVFLSYRDDSRSGCLRGSNVCRNSLEYGRDLIFSKYPNRSYILEKSNKEEPSFEQILPLLFLLRFLLRRYIETAF